MHRPKHHRTRGPGRWSDPMWSEDYNQWFSVRIDRHGTEEYCWHGSTQPDSSDQSVPRSDPLVDQVAEGVAAVDINSGTDPSGQASTNTGYASTGISHASPGPAVSSPSSTVSYTHGSAQGYSYSEDDKGKGKHVEISNQPAHTPTATSNTSIPSTSATSGLGPTSTYSSTAGAQYPAYDDPVALTTSPPVTNPYPSQGTSYSAEGDPLSSQQDDAEYQEALRQSREATYGTGTTGEPSYSGAAYTSVSSSHSSSTPSAWNTTANTGAYTINPGTYTTATPSTLNDDITPRGSPVPGNLGYGYAPEMPTNEDLLDTRYKVERSARWQPGEVFKILWSEPLGQVHSLGGGGRTEPFFQHPNRGPFYVGFRRFIIISTDESHHSTCVPILTYDRQGCNKRGVKASKHGIIYEKGTKPRPLRNEPELGFHPVCLNIYADGEKLARESRVNYSKLATIEHNTKIFFIGSIEGVDFDTVAWAVNECWDSKTHQRPSRRQRR